MKTAEQYFQELTACLGGLTDAERGSVLDYYRELRRRGRPGRLRPAGVPFRPAAGLCRAADRRAGCAPARFRPPLRTIRCARASAACWTACLPAAAPARPRPGRAGRTLEPFSGVDIHVVSADVRFEEGETFALRYCLPAREYIERCEVAGGTLHFVTRAGRGGTGGSVHLHFGGVNINLNTAEYAVIVTIPRGAQLGDFSVATVSGNCSLCDRTVGGAAVQQHFRRPDADLRGLQCGFLHHRFRRCVGAHPGLRHADRGDHLRRDPAGGRIRQPHRLPHRLRRRPL